MPNKITLTLAAALLLGAASAASAAYDPWIHTLDAFTSMSDEAITASASVAAPQAPASQIPAPVDPRDNPAIW